MKVKGIDGKEYSWNLTLYKRERPGSSGHERARILLKNLYPFDTVFEELTLPGSGPHPLRADFYLNGPKLMIEVNGSQHYVFNSFHFKNKKEFYLAKARDKRKAEWCDINKIRLIVLKDEDDDNVWRNQIVKR